MGGEQSILEYRKEVRIVSGQIKNKYETIKKDYSEFTGEHCEISGIFSLFYGIQNKIKSNYSIILGGNNEVMGNHNIVIGIDNKVYGYGNIIYGYNGEKSDGNKDINYTARIVCLPYSFRSIGEKEIIREIFGDVKLNYHLGPRNIRIPKYSSFIFCFDKSSSHFRGGKYKNSWSPKYDIFITFYFKFCSLIEDELELRSGYSFISYISPPLMEKKIMEKWKNFFIRDDLISNLKQIFFKENNNFQSVEQNLNLSNENKPLEKETQNGAGNKPSDEEIKTQNSTENKPSDEEIKTQNTIEENPNAIDMTCKICFDKQIQIIFLPCGHLATCEDCAKRVNICPMCNGQIERKQKIFIS